MSPEVVSAQSVPILRLVAGAIVAFVISAVGYELGFGPASIGLGIGLAVVLVRMLPASGGSPGQ